MARFVGRRLLFIAMVYVLIVYATHFGLRMGWNSEVAQPSYDLREPSRYAWQATRKTLGDVLRGNLGTVRTERGSVPVGDYVAEDAVDRPKRGWVDTPRFRGIIRFAG